jgi:anionic cell wall polymer biosynthesis LytR-Cps2A-Psr (LCP) family protein
MSAIVLIMDRAGFDANSDVMVIADALKQTLLWIPRDLWCDVIRDRINAAYKMGGHSLVVRALKSHNLNVEKSLCFSRTATERALEQVNVTVPVPVRMEFSYPLTPTSPIEVGSKTISFNPPAERLIGERVHQWIGARRGSDLHRIERQKILLRRLLETCFDFSAALSDPEEFRCSDPAVLDELAQIRSNWEFETMKGLMPATIDGKMVLVPV